MELHPTEEQQAIVEALRDFAAEQIRPAARDFEAAGEVSQRVESQLFEMGVAAPIPEEFGGQGTFDALTHVMVAEELAWGDPAAAYSVLGRGLPAVIIDAAGTAEQKSEWLPKLSSGHRGALALAELDAGADFTQTATTAKIANGSAAITGVKYTVPLPEGDSLLLVVARSLEDDSLGVWAVPAEECVSTREDKLGLRGAKTFKLTLETSHASDVIGGHEPDRERLQLALLRAKLVNAGIMVGLARAAHEYATRYAQERTAFGRPIGAFQAIAFKVADRAMDLETARLMVWKAAWAVDGKRPDAQRHVMAACAYAATAAVANADDGVQILGGHGYMQDHPEEMWYRDALTLATLDSPSMIGDIFLAGDYRVEAR